MKFRALMILGLAIAGCQAEAPDTRHSLPAADAPAVESSRAQTANAAAAEAAKADAPSKGKQVIRRTASMRFTGRTAALRQSAVAAKGAGLLETIAVREGDVVEAGQTLATLDTTMGTLRLRQARVAVKAANVQIKALKREVKRLEGLRAKQAVPQAELDRLRDKLDGARVQLDAGRANVAMARQSIKDATLAAPYGGVIVQRLKSEGEWISTMPPAPVFMLAQLDPLELRLEVPEAMLGKVKVGDALRVQFRAVDRTVETKVARVVPTVGPNRAFTVIAEIANPGRQLTAGLFAEAELAR